MSRKHLKTFPVREKIGFVEKEKKSLIFIQECEIMVKETGDRLIYTGLMLAEQFGVVSEQTMVTEEVQICVKTWN